MNKSKIFILITSVFTVIISIAWLKYSSWGQIEPYVVLIGTVFSILINFVLDRAILFSSKKTKEIDAIPSYSERFETLIHNLKASSKEIDKTFQEITELSLEKEKNISKLEQTLRTLSEREKELNNKIETLEKVPIEAIRHFEEALNKGDKRSAYRDYFLFLLGVFVSIIITIVLKKLNLG